MHAAKLLSLLSLLSHLSACKPHLTPAPKPLSAPPAKGVDRCPEVFVPAGTFLRGSPAGVGEKDEVPQRRLWLDNFYLDKHEVTTAQYAACTTTKACSAHHLQGDEGAGKAYSPNRYCNWRPGKGDAQPLNCVSWTQADFYCRWVGKRLPTEAEWEKAARGTDGRRFPWGNKRPNCKRAIMLWGGVGGCKRDSTFTVGSLTKGDSPYGAKDMAGNVYEWVNDWYNAKYYATAPAFNPQGPKSGQQRLVRGGSWYNYGNYLRAAYRTRLPKGETRMIHVGFRCARDGPKATSRPTSLPTLLKEDLTIDPDDRP